MASKNTTHFGLAAATHFIGSPDQPVTYEAVRCAARHLKIIEQDANGRFQIAREHVEAMRDLYRKYGILRPRMSARTKPLPEKKRTDDRAT
jgi:hypothetical protein